MAITADPFPVCFHWLLAHPSPACLPARLSTRPSCLQLGIVHEWLGRPEKMQYQVVEATAARSASPVVLLHGVPPLPCAQQKGGLKGVRGSFILQCDGDLASMGASAFLLCDAVHDPAEPQPCAPALPVPAGSFSGLWAPACQPPQACCCPCCSPRPAPAAQPPRRCSSTRCSLRQRVLLLRRLWRGWTASPSCTSQCRPPVLPQCSVLPRCAAGAQACLSTGPLGGSLPSVAAR